MRALSSPRSSLWLAAGLATLLIGLAALQWRWIGRWSAVEEARLESTLRAGADALDRDLSQALFALQDAFSEIPALDEGAAEALDASLRQWTSDAETASLVGAVYWATPGPEGRLRQLEDGALGPPAAPARLAPWLDLLRTFPARLQPESTTPALRLVLDEATFPDQPPALLVPALPPPTASDQPLRFVLLELADDALRDAILPDLIREHIVGHDLYDIRIASRSGVLYDSRSAGPLEAFDSPDLDRPLGPLERTELVFTAAATGQQTEMDLAALQSETQVESTGGRWRLQVRHRSGSIAAATRGLKLRQLALAFGVLGVLGAATALLWLSARRQRQLAERQLAFVAGVTHELRSPLAVLHSAGENLSDGVVADPAMARQYGTLVRDESRRLADMVETVLAYAGADATTAWRSRLQVKDWVQDAVDQARPVLDETESTLTLDLAPDLPEVHGDPIALATALRNLLANAARHGGASVRLSARTTHLGSDPAIGLTVADDGPGFALGTQDDLFEPFVRGHAAIETQTPGSGLGLALVRRIVEAHGGTVELTTDGETAFTITLPASS